MVDKASVGNNTMGKSVVDGMDRGSVDSMGKNRGMVNNWVGNGVDSVDRGSSNVATSRGRGVDRLTRVGNLSNVASDVVGVVGDGLDPAIGKVDRVRSSHGTGAIVGLGRSSHRLQRIGNWRGKVSRGQGQHSRQQHGQRERDGTEGQWRQRPQGQGW